MISNFIKPDSLKYALAPDILLEPDGVRRNSVIMVDRGKIKIIVDCDNFKKNFPEIKIISLPGKAIVPGFIDAHVHLGQGFMKALQGGEPSQVWKRINMPLERVVDAELSYVSAKLMMLESLRGGFTTVVNFAIINKEKADALHQAAVETGIRLVSSTGAMDLDAEGVTPERIPVKTIDEALERAEAHLTSCDKLDMVYPSLCVTNVQTGSKEMIGALVGYCLKENALFQIHANEHHPEVHSSVVKYGRRPIEYIADCGGLGRNSIVHHSTLVTESEIELLRSTESGVSYNPVASQWKGDAVCPAMAFSERGIRMGIGTDSTRCDAFRMIDAAESCQRIAFGMKINDFSQGAGWTWLDAATRGGAEIAGLGEITGQLAEGYRADFLVLDMECPETLPSWDFQWDMVRRYNRDQICAVVIDGVLIMQDGQAVSWDQQQFLKDNIPKAIKAVESASIIRVHGTSTKHRAKKMEARANRK